MKVFVAQLNISPQRVGCRNILSGTQGARAEADRSIENRVGEQKRASINSPIQPSSTLAYIKYLRANMPRTNGVHCTMARYRTIGGRGKRQRWRARSGVKNIPSPTGGWNHSRNLGEKLHSSPFRVRAIPDIFVKKKFDFFWIGDPT